MGKTMFEVMKMRKNNKQNPFPLRKYYGVNDHRIRILSWNHGVLQCDIPPEERSGKTGSQPGRTNRSELITALHTGPHKQQRQHSASTRKKQRQQSTNETYHE